MTRLVNELGKLGEMFFLLQPTRIARTLNI
jgi:hypothetical protein